MSMSTTLTSNNKLSGFYILNCQVNSVEFSAELRCGSFPI